MTKAKAKRTRRKTAPVLPCHVCLRKPCECNQGRGAGEVAIVADPIGDLCGDQLHPALLHLVNGALWFAVGLGLGWMVWA